MLRYKSTISCTGHASAVLVLTALASLTLPPSAPNRTVIGAGIALALAAIACWMAQHHLPCLEDRFLVTDVRVPRLATRPAWGRNA